MIITAASCIFPSGPGMKLADMALNAQLGHVRNHPYCVDRSGKRVRASYFPNTKDGFGLSRWVSFAKSALQDLRAQLPTPLPALVQQGKFKVWLVLPPRERAGVPTDLDEHLVRMLKEAGFNQVSIVHGGHAAPIEAMQQAKASLSANPQEVGIVLAIDCWLHSDALQWLEGERLLQNAHFPYAGKQIPNAHGRIPSEGAAAVMLMHDENGWCKVDGLGVSEEPIVRNDSRPCVGLGLSQAAAQALDSLSANRMVDHVVVDLNGEPYRADQFGFTALRLSGKLVDGWTRTAPALVSGDVGTSTSLMHAGLSAYALHCRSADKATSTKATHLLLSISDDARRGAVVLSNC